MPYTITITDDSPQALNFVKFVKTLDFVKVTKLKKALAAPKVLEEDQDGMPIAYKDSILKLSKKTKKAAAKRFYEKADKNIL